MSDSNTPFRWKIDSPEQLGSLIDSSFKLNEWVLEEVRNCAARILTFSQNSHLVFVGRSLDSIHDYLKGICEQTSWKQRLLQLNISLFGHTIRGIQTERPKSFQSLKLYFEELGIDPISIKSNKIPTSFVDVVYEGGTYEQIYIFLQKWSDEIQNDNLAMNKKLRFLGITSKKKSSPNTWRWQQDAD